MSDDLIEKVAIAIYQAMDETPSTDQQADNFARAAIAAIEASGTHRVVPMVATEEMVETANSDGKNHLTNRNLIRLFYRSMLAAAPKVAT